LELTRFPLQFDNTTVGLRLNECGSKRLRGVEEYLAKS